jgi:hypothetical protein
MASGSTARAASGDIKRVVDGGIGRVSDPPAEPVRFPAVAGRGLLDGHEGQEQQSEVDRDRPTLLAGQVLRNRFGDVLVSWRGRLNGTLRAVLAMPERGHHEAVSNPGPRT